MVLKPSEDIEGMSHILYSGNAVVFMGVYRVMYGWRVRAGFVRDINRFCILDWCGGGVWKDVERLYSICRAILLQAREDTDCFRGLPTVSLVKPFFRDMDFVRIVGQAAGDFELIELQQTPENWLPTFTARMPANAE